MNRLLTEPGAAMAGAPGGNGTGNPLAYPAARAGEGSPANAAPVADADPNSVSNPNSVANPVTSGGMPGGGSLAAGNAPKGSLGKGPGSKRTPTAAELLTRARAQAADIRGKGRRAHRSYNKWVETVRLLRAELCTFSSIHQWLMGADPEFAALKCTVPQFEAAMSKRLSREARERGAKQRS